MDNISNKSFNIDNLNHFVKRRDKRDSLVPLTWKEKWFANTLTNKQIKELMNKDNLCFGCPHMCGVNRVDTMGICNAPAELKANSS